MSLFRGKTIFISGASRGIGKAIAVRLAAEGAQIVIAAKSVVEDPRLGGTIYSAAEAVRAAGGSALAVACDIRDEAQVAHAVGLAAEHFGGIDAVVHNASAISLTGTADTPAKRYDLMQDINVRGAFLLTQYALPWLQRSSNAHILTLSPPIDLSPKWLGPHIAYTISKYNMTLLAMGWAAEFGKVPIASNALWPATTIATAAVSNLLGGEALVKRSRKPDIVAEAVFHVLGKPAKDYSGQQLIDEEVLAAEGITDWDLYAQSPGNGLQKDLFL